MNIIDYIHNYGNQSFHELPLNEVDNIVFCAFSYINFTGIVEHRPVTLSTAAKRYLKQNDSVLFNHKNLLEALIASKRYANLKICDYVDISDIQSEQQFSAISIHFLPRRYFVAFRGTDKQINSWKEDLNMSFMQPVPAQLSAKEYMDHIIARHPFSKCLVGGHSKGGNLAVYAAVKAKKQHKIIRIYNNDGPGFNKEFTELNEYKAILNRTVTFLPQGSVVGMLMNNDFQRMIILSSESSLRKQHNLFSWQIEDHYLVKVDNPSKESQFIQTCMNQCCDQMDFKEKIIFINSIYDILVSIGCNTIYDVKGHEIDFLIQAKDKFKASDETHKKIMFEATKQMIKIISGTFFNMYVKKETGKNDENTSIQ